MRPVFLHHPSLLIRNKWVRVTLRRRHMTQKLIRVLPYALVAAVVVVALAEPAFAQTTRDTLGPNDFLRLRLPIFKSTDEFSFFRLLGNVINFVLLLAGIVAFFYVLYGGFMYLTSGGDATGATKGRTMIANALVGIVIIFLSYALVNFFINLISREGDSGPTYASYLSE